MSSTIAIGAASSAVAQATVQIGVCLGELMPMDTVGLHGIERDYGCVPQDINLGGHGLHVGRVHAAGIPAQMIDLETCWNRADEEFICEAVGADESMWAGDGERPVARWATFAGPFPARLVLAHEAPEANLRWRAEGTQFGGASLPQSGIVLPAEATPHRDTQAFRNGAFTHSLIVANQLLRAS